MLVLGGSGFVGRHVVARLVADGLRVVVPTRRRENARHLILLPTVDVVEADVHDAADARAARRRRRRRHQPRRHPERGAAATRSRARTSSSRAAVVAACRAAGVRRLVQMSALNADPAGPARYQRSKGEAEAAVVASGLDWTIFQPSVIFGREDRFLNLFARLMRFLPVMALARRGRAIPAGLRRRCRAVLRRAPLRTTRRSGSVSAVRPDVLHAARARPLRRRAHRARAADRALGPGARRLQARLLELLPGTLMSRDNLASMRGTASATARFRRCSASRRRRSRRSRRATSAPRAERSPYDAYRAQGRSLTSRARGVRATSGAA